MQQEAQWLQALEKDALRLQSKSLSEWVAMHHSARCVALPEFVYDYTKNFIDDTALNTLLAFLQCRNFTEKRNDLFSGAIVNFSENRPALHTALRDLSAAALTVQGENIIPKIKTERQRFLKLADELRTGTFQGAANLPIQDVIHLGIGGSDLGPRMVSQALSHLKSKHINVHYVANSDVADLIAVLSQCNPKQTLVVISSKSFTTQETILNADFVFNWLKQTLGSAANTHLYAVTAQHHKAREYGVPGNHIFAMWDWVGGRFSMWGATGFPIAIQIGSEAFMAFLQGAFTADTHFRDADPAANIPVLMGLLDFWYANFFNAHSKTVLPYAENLALLPDYLQQLQMESNGKSVTQTGEKLQLRSSMILWGKAGSHGQHAFHQLFFQGKHFIPLDIILAANVSHQSAPHQQLTLANALSQAKALMQGQDETLPCKQVRGNQPSQFFLLKSLSPWHLGMLCAFYEHKVFVESVLLDINPFDQWGVELGKTLSRSFQAILSGKVFYDEDASSKKLLETLRTWQHDD